MLSVLALLMMLLEPSTVSVATNVDVQPSSAQQGAALIEQYRETTRAQNGNVAVDIIREIGRPSRSVVLEIWSDASSFDAHEKAPRTIEFRTKLKSIQNSPFDERVHKDLSIDSKPWAEIRDGLAVVTHVDVPPQQREAAQMLLKTLAEESRKDEGNLRYDVLQESPARTNHFTVFAVWKDRKSFDSHEMKPHTRQFRESIAPMLGAPYDERLYIQKSGGNQ